MLNSPEVPNLFTVLRSSYNPSILRDANRLICFGNKEARFTNHRIFNLRCLNNHVIPNSLRVKPLDRGVAARKIAEGASRNFLKNRIHLTCMKLEYLRNECDSLRSSLKAKLDDDVFRTLMDFVSKQRDRQAAKSKASQQKKFDALMSRTKPSTCILNPSKRTDWVKNLSSKVLNTAELSVLQKGLSFNASRNNFRKEVILAKIEASLQGTDAKQADLVRYQIAQVLRTPITSRQNLTFAERQALYNLRRDNSITILRADKGNATVVLNTEDYHAKMHEHISTGPYKKVDKPQRAILNKLKAETISLTRLLKPKLGQQLSFCLNPKTSLCPRMYGLPKIHKPNVPLRPIVDFTGSPTYAWARHLSNLLRPLMGNTPSHVHNSTTFAEEVRTRRALETDILVSYDVISLYTKVPLAQSLDIIMQKLEADDTLINRTNLSIEDILKACRLCLQSTYFTFKMSLFHQTEGLPMGSPLSPIVANLFMEDFEDKALASFHRPPTMWKRYVDDTFAIISKYAARSFFAHINKQNPSIKFTVEHETDEGTIPFLDCLVIRSPDGQLKTTVYRKPTNTGRYMQFDSCHSLSTKRGFINGLFLRAQRICSTADLLQKEHANIIADLQLNGYPLKFISKKTFKRNHTARNWDGCLSIPYVQDKSEAIRRILNTVNIRVAFTANNSIGRALSKVKDDITPGLQGNLVYKIKCQDCDTVYIGETSRPLPDRMREHIRLSRKIPKNMDDRNKLERSSAIALHAIEMNHKVNFDEPEILSQNWQIYRERIAAEQWHIALEPSACNCQKKPLHPAWNTL